MNGSSDPQPLRGCGPQVESCCSRALRQCRGLRPAQPSSVIAPQGSLMHTCSFSHFLEASGCWMRPILQHLPYPDAYLASFPTSSLIIKTLNVHPQLIRDQISISLAEVYVSLTCMTISQRNGRHLGGLWGAGGVGMKQGFMLEMASLYILQKP